ncbi:histone H3-K56 acetyltransferase [Penicillium canariense]|uniref:histone acetyltransferase n=1 Tax=Penicillium canariense TaxID=189055 RepID=A0A9W9LV16_9EURO|nr:histone H3-K56 acetyltransferase [Penicillium canariense]KAJ5177155.1 histone H3-K56 acetyltransferase [Penicillium canariense]
MAPDGDLGDLLAKLLPTGAELTVRHVSSTPAPSDALFAAAPGQDPEPTFCENHFLSVSIDSSKHGGAEIIVFGMEVLVYNTAHLTTIFVSKADSTGFLHLLKLQQKVSVLRLISSTFLSYLARSHQRPGVRLVVSLFARAQDQYLFPGSIENAEKHVLDDRGLIKWWCRALDPILREHEPESVSKDSKSHDQTVEAAKASATAYLIVPGCDRFETRSFFPASAKCDPQDRPRWLASYPLHQMCHNPSAPPRCLVPRLPDDPKTRFLIDLDDELPGPVEGENAPPSTGHWKSVKSLDQFWEMMSFRQECSAGRLVGFLWLVINPPGLMNSTTMASQTQSIAGTDEASDGGKTSKASPVEIQPQKDASESKTDETSTQPPPGAPVTETSAGPKIDPPVAFDHPPIASSAELQSTDTTPFYWPEVGRGNVVLDQADYKKAMDVVLDNFYDENDIVASTRAYIDQVASLADQLTWGKRVVGTHRPQDTTEQPIETNNLLDSGLIRKRKKPDGEEEKKGSNEASIAQPSASSNSQSAPSQPTAVNVLSAGLVRKKKKA